MPRLFKTKIKHILIVYRNDSPGIIQTVKEANKWCVQNKIKTQVCSQSALSKKTSVAKTDLILVLGGDGTYLQAVQFTTHSKAPFLGINMGSFGFLTVYRKTSLIKTLTAAIQGKMGLEKRALLDVSIKKENKEIKFSALNDMVIERGSFSHLISISVAIQNKNIYSVKADGVIVSSPTGSTAYNLAAGGPILHPQVGAFAITPISSHSLTQRPVIVPDTCEMHFKINNNKGAFLTIDGKKREQISRKHIIKMKKSTLAHPTLRYPDHNDFLLLKDKLQFSR